MEKICLIIHSLGIGGMERVMSQLANDFVKRENVEVHLVLIGRKREICYDLSESVVIHKPNFEFENSRRSIHTLRTMSFLRSKVKDIIPNSILCFGEYWNNLVLLSLAGLPYPIYISDRSEPAKDLGRVQNFLRDKLYPHAAGYIAQTDEAKKVCRSKGWNENIRVIGNPIQKIGSNGRIKKENIVLSVGRLIKTKHFDQLIRMFVDIGNPDWQLMIIGGDAKKMKLSVELNQLIKDLGAEDYIHLMGEQEDIEYFYRKSKIFAFTSSSEGFPNVIGEALSVGLPVVSYDCVAGPSDMIQHGENGFLITQFDNKSFKEKLKLLMTDENLRMKMGEKAKSSIEKYTSSAVKGKFYNFIHNN